MALTTTAKPDGSTAPRRRGPGRRGPRSGRGFGGVGPAGGDGDVGAGPAEGEDTARAGAAGAEDQDGLSGDGDRLVGQRVEEAGAVGGVAEGAAVGAGDHRVDRPEGGGVGGQFVAGAGDVLLVGHGDVEAGQAEGGHGGHRVGAPAPRYGEGDVDPVEASAAKAALCSVGESECATGSPITPTTRVWPDSERPSARESRPS